MWVHRCRFLEWTPTSVEALSFSPDGKYLAVARANSDVEIWNFQDRPFKEITVFASDDIHLRKVLWLDQSDPQEPVVLAPDVSFNPSWRLICCALNGILYEIDLSSFTIVSICDSTGGGIWDACYNPLNQTLAIGCDDSSIKIFDVSPHNLNFLKSFQKSLSRILSLTWSTNYESLFSGGDSGVITKWDPNFGLSELTMKAYPNEGECCVWAIHSIDEDTYPCLVPVLSPRALKLSLTSRWPITIVTGDSLGQLIYWSVSTGTLLSILQTRTGDIYTILATSSQLFYSGVDSRIGLFHRRGGEWIPQGSKTGHFHPIRALACFGSTLVSAGEDGALVRYSSTDFTSSCCEKLLDLPKSVCQISTEQKTVAFLVYNGKTIEIWQLALYPENVPLTDGVRTPEAKDRLILQLKLTSTSNLSIFAYAPNGKYLLFSDMDQPRLYHLTPPAIDYQIVNLPNSVSAVFSHTSEYVFLSSRSGTLYCIEVASNSLKFQIDADPILIEMEVSKDDAWLVGKSVQGLLYLFDLINESYHQTLPKPDSPITSFHFLNSQSILYVTADDHLVQYNFQSQQSVLSLQLRLPSVTHTIISLPEDTLLLVGSGGVLPLKMGKGLTECSLSRKHETSAVFRRNSVNVHYQNVLRLDMVSKSECVVVEIPWSDVLSRLPEVLDRKRFGI